MCGTRAATESAEARSATKIVAFRPSDSIFCLVSWLDSSRWRVLSGLGYGHTLESWSDLPGRGECLRPLLLGLGTLLGLYLVCRLLLGLFCLPGQRAAGWRMTWLPMLSSLGLILGVSRPCSSRFTRIQYNANPVVYSDHDTAKGSRVTLERKWHSSIVLMPPIKPPMPRCVI